VHYFQERRVDDQGLGLPDQLGQDLPAQGFEETPQFPHAAMQRGGMQPDDPGEQVREEPLGIAQEGPLALYAPKLLEKRQRQDLAESESRLSDSWLLPSGLSSA
jgi:hypothetical protein